MDPYIANSVPLEPILTAAARKYIAAIRAWHIAQSWPPPLSNKHMDQINWSLRGLGNMQGSKHKCPLRPPISIVMLRALKATLVHTEPFDACVWAMASCAFWGMMCFGEVSVTSRSAFSGSKHLKRCDATLSHDMDRKPYALLDLLSAKTAHAGEIQSVFMVSQDNVCPLNSLHTLAAVVPAGPDDPLFSW
jgi:hypothetical protein